MSAISFLYVTTPTKAEALSIGRALLEKKVAACFNLWDAMESHYWWEGKIEKANETVMIVKTVTEKVDAVIAIVKAMHSYSTPCVVSWPIEKGNPDYLKWLRESVSP